MKDFSLHKIDYFATTEDCFHASFHSSTTSVFDFKILKLKLYRKFRFIQYVSVLVGLLSFSFGCYSQNIFEVGANVGIGTNNPGGKLSILSGSGSASFLTGTTGLGNLIYFNGANGTNLSFNMYTPSLGDLKTRLGINYAVHGGNGYMDYAIIGSKKSPFLELNAEAGSISLYGENGTGGDWRTPTVNLGLSVAGNGNVGIGTTSPAYSLEVVANNVGSSVMGLKNEGTARHTILDFYNANSEPSSYRNIVNAIQTRGTLASPLALVSGDQLFSIAGTGYDGIDYKSNFSQDIIVDATVSSGVIPLAMVWKTTNSPSTRAEVMRLSSNGNLGIGTIAPQDYRLAVNGNAIFTKVKVLQYTSWPDYVFQSTYKLRPLADVEKFIQQNNHLPEVPSASEVQKNGLDLGDNQAVLLKKIEELTLYLIEQNKKIEELQKEVSKSKFRRR